MIQFSPRLRFLAGLAAGAAIATMSSGAAAQSTWNLGGSACNPGGGSPNSAVCSVGSVQATMTTYGNTGAGNSYVLGTIGAYDPYGFGATTGANETGYDSQHAFDNVKTGCSNVAGQTACGGGNEVLLVGFGAAKVNLSALAIGLFSGDADMSVLRWDGAGNPTAGGLLGTGWTLVSSKDVDTNGVAVDNPNVGGVSTSEGAYRYDVATGSGYGAASDGKVSSWWLISTYFGSTNGNLDTGNDRFKLVGLTANVCTGAVTGGAGGNGGSCGTTGTAVPEPGSLALAGAALAGLFYSRRRRAA